MATRDRIASAVVVTLVCVTATTACSSSKTSAGDSSNVDLNAARKYIQPYVTKPTTFPVKAQLSRGPPANSKVVYLDMGTPVSASIWQNLQPAAKTLGVQMVRVNVGQNAQTINTALNSVVALKPAAVIDVAVDPTFFAPQLKQLRDNKTAVIAGTIVNGPKFGFPDSSVLAGRESSIESGRVLAAAALVKTDAKATNLVFYNVPELPFSNLEQQGAKEQISKLCPKCDLRTVNIPLSQIGTSAAQTIVSDLQAHPKTQAFVAALDEMQIGYPQASRVANITVKGLGQYPAGINYKQLAQKGELGSLLLTSRWFLGCSWTAQLAPSPDRPSPTRCLTKSESSRF